MKPWRMKEKCENCPFHKTGPGRQLRDSLQPGRFAEIKRSLLNEEVFWCHKTTNEDGWDEETGDYIGRGLVCAGAIEFQKQHKVACQYVQVCERLELRSQMKKEESCKQTN